MLDLGIPEFTARQNWPNLREGQFDTTSHADAMYNCVAWAMDDTDTWWEPSGKPRHYWPSSVRRSYAVDAYIEAFGTRGFEICVSGDFESGFEKIAIYGSGSNVEHVARQLEDGRWSSKLAEAKDITHAWDDLTGNFYGTVIRFMRRPRG